MSESQKNYFLSLIDTMRKNLSEKKIISILDALELELQCSFLKTDIS